MKIQLKRSNVLENSSAKLPTAAQLEYGELAVNYNDSDPAIFMKDSNDNIIRISGVGNISDDGQVEVPALTNPSSLTPDPGNLWYNTTDGRLYIYFQDADSSQWVDASPDSWDPTVLPDSSDDEIQSGTIDERYVSKVATTSQDIAGNLTLGTDKITLDAGDGSAAFAGTVVSGGAPDASSSTNNGSSLNAGRIFNQLPSGSSSTVEAYGQYYGTDSVISFKADGSASFAGGSSVTGGTEIRIGNGQAAVVTNDGFGKAILAGSAFALTNTSGVNTVLFATGDGSASFAGTVYSAGDSSTDQNGWYASPSQIGVQTKSTAPTSTCFASHLGAATTANRTIEFLANGSAEFAGNVVTDASFVSNNSNGSFVNISAVPFDSGTIVYGHWDGSRYLSSIAATGAASFANGDFLIHDSGTLRLGSPSSSTSGGNIILSSDGSATFAGAVYGTGWNLGADQSSFYIEKGSVYVHKSSGTSALPAFIVYSGAGDGVNNRTAEIFGNGSASFNSGNTTINSAGQITTKRTDGSSSNLGVWVAQNSAGTNTSIIYADGSATFTGTVSAQGSVLTSDARFKTNVQPAKPQLADVVRLGNQLKTWDWTEDAPVTDKDTRFLGLIAQELEGVCPTLTTTIARTKTVEVEPAVLSSEGEVIKDAVTEEVDDSYKGIKNDVLIMKLLGAVAELTAQVEELKSAL